MIGIDTTISPDASKTQRSVTSSEAKRRLDTAQVAAPIEGGAK
jgi:hypothetical protein